MKMVKLFGLVQEFHFVTLTRMASQGTMHDEITRRNLKI